MSSHAVAIRHTGLVTSVGLTAPAACAAIRAKLTNPSETRFVDSAGEWITAHEVPLEMPWRGLTKLARMAAMAIEECLEDVQREAWPEIPLLLCVAERERPGRHDGLDDQLFIDIQDLLGTRFSPDSAIVAQGRVGAAVALAQARQLIHVRRIPQVLIAATDSLLNWSTLSVYERADRLLTGTNSNGFIPGEAGGALLLGAAKGVGELTCVGIGFGVEKAHVDSGEPLRAEGLASAIKSSLMEADCRIHEIDGRVTDLSGEQYYFKEASLAISRTLRQRMKTLDLWHPAECVGEAGASAGILALAIVDAACRKAYSPGPVVLAHMANDGGQRAAVVLRFEGAA